MRPTPDIVLRTPVHADARAIEASVRGSLAELAPWLPWANESYGLADALGWMDGKFGDVHSFVILGPDGEHLGNVGLNTHDPGNRRVNLGYWIRSDCAGRGIATEAVRQVAQFAFEETDLHRLEILMSVENEGSRRVAEKVGAHYEGIARSRVLLHGRQHDAHVFSLIR